jgi:hypothetical protein
MRGSSRGRDFSRRVRVRQWRALPQTIFFLLLAFGLLCAVPPARAADVTAGGQSGQNPGEDGQSAQAINPGNGDPTESATATGGSGACYSFDCAFGAAESGGLAYASAAGTAVGAAVTSVAQGGAGGGGAVGGAAGRGGDATATGTLAFGGSLLVNATGGSGGLNYNNPGIGGNGGNASATGTGSTGGTNGASLSINANALGGIAGTGVVYGQYGTATASASGVGTGTQSVAVSASSAGSVASGTTASATVSGSGNAYASAAQVSFNGGSSLNNAATGSTLGGTLDLEQDAGALGGGTASSTLSLTDTTSKIIIGNVLASSGDYTSVPLVIDGSASSSVSIEGSHTVTVSAMSYGSPVFASATAKSDGTANTDSATATAKSQSDYGSLSNTATAFATVAGNGTATASATQSSGVTADGTGGLSASLVNVVGGQTIGGTLTLNQTAQGGGGTNTGGDAISQLTYSELKSKTITATTTALGGTGGGQAHSAIDLTGSILSTQRQRRRAVQVHKLA